jgi:hypothetical protein
LEKKREEQVLPESGSWGGEVAPTMYTYVNKCKNDKIKEKIKSIFYMLKKNRIKHMLGKY